jgi:hypothetical protein
MDYVPTIPHSCWKGGMAALIHLQPPELHCAFVKQLAVTHHPMLTPLCGRGLASVVTIHNPPVEARVPPVSEGVGTAHTCASHM